MIIAQISDTHVTSADAPAATQVRRAVDHLLRLPAPPDAVIVSGDCANGGRAEEYELFRELLRPLPMPVYVVPGNHDDRERLMAAFGPQGAGALPGFVQYTVEGWPVRLIALDTHVPSSDAGELCDARLGWLAERLAEAREQPTLIFMHHPPFRTGLHVFDQIGLSGADALGELVARHPQVERIVAGHVHSAMLRRFGGTVAQTCPATAYQLLPDVQQHARLEVVFEPPACLLHVWGEDSGLLTYTSQIGEHGPRVVLHDGNTWVPG